MAWCGALVWYNSLSVGTNQKRVVDKAEVEVHNRTTVSSEQPDTGTTWCKHGVGGMTDQDRTSWLRLATGHLKLYKQQKHVGLNDAAAKSLSRAMQCLGLAMARS